MAESHGWSQLVLRVRAERAQWVSEALLLAGSAGVEWLDEEHPQPPSDLPRGQVELRGSLPLDSDPQELRRRLDELLEAGERECVRIVSVDSRDWAESWKEHFEAVRIGRFFIHPGWVEPGPADGLALRIDPGLAFGTGMHPTTRLCLAELDRALPVDSLLDVGCGSGILALAGALAGVDRILAMDNDPEAVRVSRENARINGLEHRLRIQGESLAEVPERYRLVLANILSGTLLSLASDLRTRLEPGARLVLSGVLGEEAEEVRVVFEEQGLVHLTTVHMDEWCAIRLQAPGG